jgi:hypothetical protein
VNAQYSYSITDPKRKRSIARVRRLSDHVTNLTKHHVWNCSGPRAVNVALNSMHIAVYLRKIVWIVWFNMHGGGPPLGVLCLSNMDLASWTLLWDNMWYINPLPRTGAQATTDCICTPTFSSASRKIFCQTQPLANLWMVSHGGSPSSAPLAASALTLHLTAKT